MRAMILPHITSLDGKAAPLQLVELPTPVPGPGEVLIRVAACGVCHTDLDEIEGRVEPPRLPIVLGHEVVGRVAGQGPGATRFQEGDRLGVGWIHSSSGGTDENLSPAFRATGRDVNAGYAEFMTAREDYAFPLPACFTDVEAAPLLCAGAVGYRALKLSNLTDGEPLGLTGFGGSAHLVLQLARSRFPKSPAFVFARDAAARRFACELGAAWAGDIADRSPERACAIIDTTPAWRPVVEALSNLRPGGRLVINAIRKEELDKSCLLELSYHAHLWMEREIKTVANVTHDDIAECLALAAEIPLRPETVVYPLQQANQALLELKRGGVCGAKVLAMN
jgi:propanol-preferring alcohol dehydrogenase